MYLQLLVHEYGSFFRNNVFTTFFSAQALSGVFLAEQIRQQQLAAALESRLDSQSFSAIQAALLMNKLKAGAAVAEPSKLLAAAAAAAAASSNTASNNAAPATASPSAASNGSQSMSTTLFLKNSYTKIFRANV